MREPRLSYRESDGYRMGERERERERERRRRRRRRRRRSWNETEGVEIATNEKDLEAVDVFTVH